MRRKGFTQNTFLGKEEVARMAGFEPTTPAFEARCSCPLSYMRKRAALFSILPELNFSLTVWPCTEPDRNSYFVGRLELPTSA